MALNDKDFMVLKNGTERIVINLKWKSVCAYNQGFDYDTPKTLTLEELKEVMRILDEN